MRKGIEQPVIPNPRNRLHALLGLDFDTRIEIHSQIYYTVEAQGEEYLSRRCPHHPRHPRHPHRSLHFCQPSPSARPGPQVPKENPLHGPVQ